MLTVQINIISSENTRVFSSKISCCFESNQHIMWQNTTEEHHVIWLVNDRGAESTPSHGVDPRVQSPLPLGPRPPNPHVGPSTESPECGPGCIDIPQIRSPPWKGRSAKCLRTHRPGAPRRRGAFAHTRVQSPWALKPMM